MNELNKTPINSQRAESLLVDSENPINHTETEEGFFLRKTFTLVKVAAVQFSRKTHLNQQENDLKTNLISFCIKRTTEMEQQIKILHMGNETIQSTGKPDDRKVLEEFFKNKPRNVTGTKPTNL